MPELTDYDPARDLCRAETLPSRWYLDPDLFALERERVFRRTWQWMGAAADVSSPGDYLTADVFGEPLVVARGDDGELRALSNVCRHRAGPVAEGKGRRKQLQCGYHGWVYGLDGRLRRAAEMEDVAGFDVTGVCLPAVPVVSWGPLLFVKLDGSGPSFEEILGDIPSEVKRAGFPVDEMRLVERRDYLVESNWKIYVDNYLEGYHIPFIHPALFQRIDYERYRVDASRWTSRQHTPLRGEDEDALYYWVFPNLMLNFYPGSMQVNYVLPLDAARSLTVFEWYALGSREDILEAIEFSEQVQQEDLRMCGIVQKGVASRTYDRGRLSARRENGVHHFHRLLHETLGAAKTDPTS